jgi:multisubunit Na+/H+ antiporter MnhC subunit
MVVVGTNDYPSLRGKDQTTPIATAHIRDRSIAPVIGIIRPVTLIVAMPCDDLVRWSVPNPVDQIVRIPMGLGNYIENGCGVGVTLEYVVRTAATVHLLILTSQLYVARIEGTLRRIITQAIIGNVDYLVLLLIAGVQGTFVPIIHSHGRPGQATVLKVATFGPVTVVLIVAKCVHGHVNHDVILFITQIRGAGNTI